MMRSLPGLPMEPQATITHGGTNDIGDDPFSRDLTLQISITRSPFQFQDAAKDITQTLTTLKTGAEETMSSLHRLQTAAINANGGRNSPQFRDLFAQVRRSLFHELDSTIRFLRQCYDFADKASFLLNNQYNMDSEEFADYIEGLASQSAKLLATCQYIISLQQGINRNVDRWTPSIAQFFLHHPITRPIYEKVSAEDPDTSQFVASNIFAAYPDGYSALTTLTIALRDTRASLTSISHLWSSVYNDCYNLTQTPEHLLTNTVDGRSLLKGWSENREQILHVISHITKICDAISVEAVGAHLQPVDNRRRRKSSYSSLNSLRSPLPRRSTSSSCNGLPNCWSFLFSSKRR